MSVFVRSAPACVGARLDGAADVPTLQAWDFFNSIQSVRAVVSGRKYIYCVNDDGKAFLFMQTAVPDATGTVEPIFHATKKEAHFEGSVGSVTFYSRVVVLDETSVGEDRCFRYASKSGGDPITIGGMGVRVSRAEPALNTILRELKNTPGDAVPDMVALKMIAKSDSHALDIEVGILDKIHADKPTCCAAGKCIDVLGDDATGVKRKKGNAGGGKAILMEFTQTLNMYIDGQLNSGQTGLTPHLCAGFAKSTLSCLVAYREHTDFVYTDVKDDNIGVTAEGGVITCTRMIDYSSVYAPNDDPDYSTLTCTYHFLDHTIVRHNERMAEAISCWGLLCVFLDMCTAHEDFAYLGEEISREVYGIQEGVQHPISSVIGCPPNEDDEDAPPDARHFVTALKGFAADTRVHPELRTFLWRGLGMPRLDPGIDVVQVVSGWQAGLTYSALATAFDAVIPRISDARASTAGASRGRARTVMSKDEANTAYVGRTLPGRVWADMLHSQPDHVYALAKFLNFDGECTYRDLDGANRGFMAAGWYARGLISTQGAPVGAIRGSLLAVVNAMYGAEEEGARESKYATLRKRHMGDDTTYESAMKSFFLGLPVSADFKRPGPAAWERRFGYVVDVRYNLGHAYAYEPDAPMMRDEVKVAGFPSHADWAQRNCACDDPASVDIEDGDESRIRSFISEVIDKNTPHLLTLDDQWALGDLLAPQSPAYVAGMSTWEYDNFQCTIAFSNGTVTTVCGATAMLMAEYCGAALGDGRLMTSDSIMLRYPIAEPNLPVTDNFFKLDLYDGVQVHEREDPRGLTVSSDFPISTKSVGVGGSKRTLRSRANIQRNLTARGYGAFLGDWLSVASCFDTYGKNNIPGMADRRRTGAASINAAKASIVKLATTASPPLMSVSAELPLRVVDHLGGVISALRTTHSRELQGWFSEPSDAIVTAADDKFPFLNWLMLRNAA